MTVKLLKKIKLILRSFYSKIRGKKNKFIKVNLDETFPCFAPRSGGDFLQKAKLTIESINETIPAINLLIENLNDFPEPLTPVKTVSVSRGILRLTFFRLCSEAPFMIICSDFS